MCLSFMRPPQYIRGEWNFICGVQSIEKYQQQHLFVSLLLWIIHRKLFLLFQSKLLTVSSAD